MGKRVPLGSGHIFFMPYHSMGDLVVKKPLYPRKKYKDCSLGDIVRSPSDGWRYRVVGLSPTKVYLQCVDAYRTKNYLEVNPEEYVRV